MPGGVGPGRDPTPWAARSAAGWRLMAPPRQWRHWRHAKATQESQNRLHRLDRQEIFVTSGATGTQKAFHLACVQISRAEALVPEPTAQVGQQPHLLTGGTWPITLVREFV